MSIVLLKAPPVTSRLYFALALIAAVTVSACRSDVSDLAEFRCVSRQPEFHNSGAGYELLNLRSGEVWATGDWTPDEFSQFELPTSRIFWRKNGPRVGLADEAAFLRSPNCDQGEYTYLEAFGREFVQVVDLGPITKLMGIRGPIQRVELEKYHVLTYWAGTTVSTLKNSAGEAFVAVAVGLDRADDLPTLPEGWTITERTLEHDQRIELLGNVSVLRLDNGDSYQGPVTL
jgi:hypothetical protein